MPNEPSRVEIQGPAAPDTLGLAELSAEIDRIKSRLEEDKRGFLGWVRKYGLVIAFAGGLLAIPRGVYDLYKLVNNALLEVEVEKAEDVPLTVLKKDDGSVEYLFSVKVRNRSNDNFEMKLRQVEIIPQNLTTLEGSLTTAIKTTCFDSPDEVTAGKPTVPLSLDVKGRTQMIIRCQAVLRPGASTGALFEIKTKQRLLVRFEGEDGKPRLVDYCFLSPGPERENRPAVFDCDE